MPRKNTYITVTDQFCGAGGSSIGATAAGAEVSLALNHWPLAIETHNANFPDTLHDCADVSATDPRRYPSTDIMIASPECTNHSVAKGAKRRQRQLSLFDKPQIDPSAERSRATMWDVPRFAEYHNYNLIITENVVDARAWLMWDAWILAMQSLGYDHKVVYLNSMFAHLDPTTVSSASDFAPQSRDRMYVVFWKRGNKAPNLNFQPQAYCPRCESVIAAHQTWKPTPTVRGFGGEWGRYGNQYIYTCHACLLDVHRKYGRSLKIAHLQEAEVIPYYFAAANAIDWSIPAQRIGDRQRPLKPKTLARVRRGLELFGNQYMLVELAFGHAENNRARPITAAQFTQSTRQSQALLIPNSGFLCSTNNFDDRNIDAAIAPMGTQTTQTKWGLVTAPFVCTLRGTNVPTGVDEPLSTFAASGLHHSLVFPPAFLQSYYGTENKRGIGEAMPTVTAVDRHALIQAPFLLGYANGDGPAKGSSDPLRTLHTENGQAIVNPKPRLEECGFRMLQPHEIGAGMAFPSDYIVKGTSRDQVRQYGNAVTPIAMRQLVGRCLASFA